MHDRVPDERDLEDVVALDLCGGRELRRELREAPAHDLRELFLRSRVEHHVRHAAHQILAEADLRIHLAGGGEHLAGGEIAEVPRHGRRADVERDAVRAIVETGPDAGDRVAVVDGDRDRPVPGAQRGLHRGQQVGIDRERVQAPLVRERLAEAADVAARAAQLGAFDLHVVEPHDRVDLDRVGVGLLADDLTVELALGWDVDDEVAGDGGNASEPAPLGEPALGGVPRLDLVGRREVGRRRRDAVLGMLALRDLDLTATADATAAADRVEVHAESPRRVEERRPVLEPSSPAGRREDDEGVGGHHWVAALRRPSRPPRRPRIASELTVSAFSAIQPLQ